MVISIPIPMPSLQLSIKPDNSFSKGMPPLCLDTTYHPLSYVLVQFAIIHGLSPMVSSSKIDARPLPLINTQFTCPFYDMCLKHLSKAKTRGPDSILMICLNPSLQYFMTCYLFIYFKQCYVQTSIRTLEHIPPPFSCSKMMTSTSLQTTCLQP